LNSSIRFPRILYEYSEGWRRNERNVWFGQDGRLVALADPVALRSTRPITYDEDEAGAEEAVATDFWPAALPGPEGQPNVGAAESKTTKSLSHCQLEVRICFTCAYFLNISNWLPD
jgi:hypothetical protein